MTENHTTLNPARSAVSCVLAATLALGTVSLGSLTGCAGDEADTATTTETTETTTEATEAAETTTTEAAEVTDDGAATPEATVPEAAVSEATVLGSAPDVEEGWPGVERPHEYGMSDGEAVYDARQYLGVSEEDVEVLEVARVWYEERGCYDVALQTKDSGAVQHVLVDAQNGQTLASWAE